MTSTWTRFGRALGVAAIVVATAGVAYQNISAQGPGGRGGPGAPGGPMGRRGGPGGPMGPGGPGGLMSPMVIGQLNLTSDQQDRVKQILDSHRDEQRTLGQRAMTAHMALQDAVSSSTFDESAIRGRAADVAAVDADEAVAQAKIYGEVFQVLTSDQQSKLQQIQADMKSRAQQMQQRGPGGPGGRRGQRP